MFMFFSVFHSFDLSSGFFCFVVDPQPISSFPNIVFLPRAGAGAKPRVQAVDDPFADPSAGIAAAVEVCQLKSTRKQEPKTSHSFKITNKKNEKEPKETKNGHISHQI